MALAFPVLVIATTAVDVALKVIVDRDRPMDTLVGKTAPQFQLNAYANGEFQQISSDSLKGKWTVLLFYPLDFTFV